MFEKGSYVIKTMNKVCKVEDIVRIDEKSNRLYYLLIPIDEKREKIYSPVDRTDLNMRSVMTKEEVIDLIRDIPKIEQMTINDERFREQKYKEVIKSEDPKLLVGIIKMIYLRNRKRTAEGKKYTSTDQKYFQIAEDNLYSEIAFVLKKDKNEICQLIKDYCDKNNVM